MTSKILPPIHLPKSASRSGEKNDKQQAEALDSANFNQSTSLGCIRRSESLNRREPLSNQIPSQRRPDFCKLKSKTLVSKQLVDLPNLPKAECRKLKYTFCHKLCVEILEQGFHDTFCGIDKLIRLQDEMRSQAGPESSFWQVPLLKENSEKLLELQKWLQQAEYSSRKADFETSYDSYQRLAKYFDDRGHEDRWLADYFYDECLRLCRSPEAQNSPALSDGRLECDALYHVACSKRLAGDIPAAIDLLNQAAKLADNQTWLDESGELIFLKISRAQIESLQLLAERARSDEKIQLLKRACDVADSADEPGLQADAQRQLGVALAAKREDKKGVASLKKMLAHAEHMDDAERRCDALRLLASTHQRGREPEKASECLEKVREIAAASGAETQLAAACAQAGQLQNAQGLYSEATANLSKAYTIAKTAASDELDSIRVNLGIAMAHEMLGRYRARIISSGNRGIRPGAVSAMKGSEMTLSQEKLIKQRMENVNALLVWKNTKALPK